LAAERRDQREAIGFGTHGHSFNHQSRLKSFHLGLSDSIRTTFFSRPPGFDLFFSIDCVADIRVLLEINQSIQMVLAGKARNRLALVPECTPHNIFGNSSYEVLVRPEMM
jgi:hypothetical protein